ncbi:uncharacterized protein LOC125015204 [Mugil cephalus]|uniref:uncharacterized protein LOC125015204 n=1 Tax=Mugil cephalus TaxID=48193 RepID=UPI001FB7557C|nr:uncharacterized protein LOC125015204 [Mugil cephalus]
MLLCYSLFFVLCAWATGGCDLLPDGVLHIECRDRYVMIAVKLSFTGPEPRFEAVDRTGVHSITGQYAAKCGYSVSVVNHVELRASYFSCHTDINDDKVFKFNFNLIVNVEGKEVSYALDKTCSPSLPWSPREVTCETNYMEVSVRSELTCPSGTRIDDWSTLKPVYSAVTSDWQVMFQMAEEQLPPMNLSVARRRGYLFDLTEGRLIFRAPYGQPDSYSTEVNGVPVEVVHATVFSRQSWFVIMVDLVTACSMHQGSYDDDGYMTWALPEALYTNTDDTKISIGLSGELMEQPVAEQIGYAVEKHNATVHISIPYNAEGGYRVSFVADGLYELYIFNLYLAQTLLDEDRVETVIRFHRTLVTRPLPRTLFTENQTVLEEQMFTVYLGDVPEDVELAAVHVNGQELTNASSQYITKVVQPNNTHGYTLKVPFDDPVVIQEFSKEDAAMQHTLDINYTLTVVDGNEPYYHTMSVMALTDASPPVFDATCSDSGISFKLDHQPSDYLWAISIGSDELTSELATQRGYIMSNDSQSLLLTVPLYTDGYEYKDITLKGFFGTFEIVVRHRATSEVQTSTVKTCLFTSTELIMCSTDGVMTVVADLTLAVPSGGTPARTNLGDKHCGPKEVDGTRALFSFPLNSCGSKVKLGKENVTYQNEIFYHKEYVGTNEFASEDGATERVIMQCIYPLAGLHRLFSKYKFESDTDGVGIIIHTAPPTPGLLNPTIGPTTGLQTTRAPSRQTTQTQSTATFLSNVRYIKVAKHHNPASSLRKGAETSSQIKMAIEV